LSPVDKPYNLSDLAEDIIYRPRGTIPVDEETAKNLPLTAIIWFDAEGDLNKGEFNSYLLTFPRNSPANKKVKAGDGYIVIMKKGMDIMFTGYSWGKATPAAPASSLPNTKATPILIVKGSIKQTETNRLLNGLEVTVRNQNTGIVVSDTTGFIAGDGRYVALFADFATKRAAQVGDRLEIQIKSHSGEFDSETFAYTVQERDINTYIVSFDNLQLSQKPREPELLPNYPSPFNPETWIPYKLSNDSEVTIKIFNISGELVRILNLGYKTAGYYLNKEKAGYWDGRNSLGEKVASGVYFYSIQAGNFTAIRKTVLLK